MTKPGGGNLFIMDFFVGATLRGRPLMGKISFQCRPRRHVSLDKLKENRYNKTDKRYTALRLAISFG